jgi:catechol 2,3-dioxygenase-like lactoylglutathione lyase family enzyme
MNARLIRGSLILGACCALAWGAALPVMAHGGGRGFIAHRGIDHVASLVRLENFNAARGAMVSKLGFSATPALLSPLGAKNSLIWFDDLSYLEVATFTENNEFTAPFLAFLAEHEGGKFFGTEVKDIDDAIADLNAAGYPNIGPLAAPPLTIEATGDTFGFSPMWQSIILTSVVAPDNSNFFLKYDETVRSQAFADFPAIAPHPHPNTAKKIDTVWMVVSDLDAAIAYYEGLGLRVHSKHQKIHYLGGRGASVEYGNATLALLEPDGPGIVASFAAERGEGILGAAVSVRSVHTALNYVNGHTGLHLQKFKYKGRDRFLVPRSLTNGFLIEMVE